MDALPSRGDGVSSRGSSFAASSDASESEIRQHQEPGSDAPESELRQRQEHHSDAPESELRQRRPGNVSVTNNEGYSGKEPSQIRLKQFANVVKANLRIQDVGFDLAYKEASLQRPLTEAEVATSQGNTTRRPVYGDIQFSSGMLTHYAIIGHNADPAICFDRVTNHPDVWNLETPRLLLSIMGGAGNMDMDPSVESSFSEGLVRVAKQTGAWVLTGGTDSGVMALAGQAMHNHDKKRTVPCIGITSFGSLKSKWRSQVDEMNQEDFGRLKIVDAPSIQVDDEKGLAAIQEHHTHSILVDDGKRGPGAFGQEAKFRAEFEHHVARMLSKSNNLEGGDGNETKKFERTQSRQLHRRRSSTNPLEVPNGEGPEALRVMILLNGGAVSFESVFLALDHECPVVVCRGSGRAADFLAALKDRPNLDYEEAWEMHMTAPADKKQWVERWGLDGPEGKGKLQKIVTSNGLVVYSSKDRLEDVVIGAVLQSIWARGAHGPAFLLSLQHSLDLAVRWNCTKHCRDLCARYIQAGEDDDVNRFEDGVSWIIDQMTTKEWIESDASHIAKVLMELYPSGMRSFHMDALSPLRWNGIASFHQDVKQDTVEEHDDDDQEKHVDHRGDSVAALFLWLIENGASRAVLDVFWIHQEYPAHAALAAASCYRQMMSRAQYGRTQTTREGRRLEDEADRFESLAINLVASLDRINPLDYLFNHSRDWGGHNLVTLAHHLECKNFVMEQFYESAVDMLWFMPAPFEEYYFKDKSRASLMGVSLFEIVRLAVMSSTCKDKESLRQETNGDEADAMDPRKLWSVPKVKALTHSLFRIVFICCYSWFVLFSEGLSQMCLRLLLFVWGISLGLVEILQIREKKSLLDYLNMWNILDLILIILLLTSVLVEWLLVPFGVLSHMDVHVLHALNLLPCYVRLLQMLELSEYFGTLLVTIVDMFVDTAHFMVLLFVVGLGFSCTLTPILWPSTKERWDQGVFWTFWAIFGERDEKDNRSVTQSTLFGFMVNPLMYFLYLTLNVLLVNLLIAMLSDTYAQNKESSKRVWAFQCVDAVLEFASPDTHLLPPPLDLGISLRAVFRGGSGHADDARQEGGDCCWKAPSRQERRTISHLMAKILENESDSSLGETETAEAMLQLERRLRVCSGQLDKLSEVKALTEEISVLRKENNVLKESRKFIEDLAKLRQENAALKAENDKLKVKPEALS